jgi:hypothetical protein
MRELADAGRIRSFMRGLGRSARTDATCYLAGGGTAVLLGWRASTIDVDVKLVPEDDALLRAIQRLKNELSINVELASPAEFLPLAAGWEERSLYEDRVGRLTFRHFDLYAQALAKLERAHVRDLEDVAAMVERGFVDPERALSYFAEIEPQLYRFPAVDARAFRARVEEALANPAR